jgi:electron transfer flavoprotein alpha subunit
MATVRPRSSRPLEEDTKRTGAVIRFSLGDTLPGGGRFSPLREGRTRVKTHRRDETAFANLEEAEVIVAGGRGLKRGDNFAILREVAKSLGGEVGATRDAVDRGWISYPHQVGLSGKTVSPKLYMGIGISGAIQHLAGIKTSETIVSINIDPEANLHKLADLAIVGDAFEVLGELKKRLLDNYSHGGTKAQRK